MTQISIPKQEEGGINKVTTVDLSVKELLIEMSNTLKKIEYHLAIASDTNLNDQDV